MNYRLLASHEHPSQTAPLAAAIVTAAAFGKLFVPFYLIGSTAIFVFLCAAGFVLIALNWRSIRQDARYAYDALAGMGILYGVFTTSYLAHSSNQVPITQLLGVIIFHAIFILFGFAASRSLTAIFIVLLGQAAVYLIYILRYLVEFGDIMRGGFLQNIFHIEDFALASALHNHISGALGLALVSMFGFRGRAVRFLALAMLPIVFFFILHLSARSVLVALTVALVFQGWAELWLISKKRALTSIVVLILLAVAGSTLFYRFALIDANVHPETPNIVARTIREIQSDDPGNRLPMWARTWHRLESDPRQLVLGRGVGAFPIDEGAGAPDWLLHKTEAARHYPHNVYLEVLYESGVFALFAFGFLTLFPLVYSLKNWRRFEMSEKTGISLYVFYLASEQLSGAFAYDYGFQFFLALAIGIVGLKRKQLAGTTGVPLSQPSPA